MKKHLLSAFKILVSLAGILFIVFLVKSRWNEVVRVFASFRPEVFAAAVAVFFVSLAIITVRFGAILRVQEIRLPFRTLLYFNGISLFFSLFLPSAIGGDVVKGYYVYKQSSKKVGAFTSIFLDRFVGSLGILAFGLVAILYYGEKLNLAPLRNWTLLLGGAMLLTLVFLLNKNLADKFRFLKMLIPSEKLRELIAHVYHTLNYYQNHKKVLVKGFLISLVGQAFFIAVQYLLARSLSIEVPYATFFLVVPIVTVLSMAPSINGLGVREAGFVYLFGKFMSSEQALALSLVFDALVYGIGIFFGVLYLFREGFRAAVVHEAMDMEEQVEKIEEQELELKGKDGKDD